MGLPAGVTQGDAGVECGVDGGDAFRAIAGNPYMPLMPIRPDRGLPGGLYGEHRTVDVVQDLLGGAAREELPHRVATSQADDDETTTSGSANGYVN